MRAGVTKSTNVHPLHPDDAMAQIELNASLTGLRRHFGYSPDVYAQRLGITFSAVSHMERHPAPNMRLQTIEARAALVYRTLTITPHDLPDVSQDPYVAFIARRELDTPEGRAENTAAWIIGVCDAARQVLGLTIDATATRMGITHAAVTRLHSNPTPGMLLGTAQRYARALGGHLQPQLIRMETS